MISALALALACSSSAPAPTTEVETEPIPDPPPPTEEVTPSDELEISSPAFEDHGQIPAEFTCEGDDVNPPLEWSGVPERAARLALVVSDPDAPSPGEDATTWTHWVLYNLPPETEGLPRKVTDLPEGTMVGKNDWDRTDWGGPCPPMGRHRYFFRLYALAAPLALEEPTREELLEAMEGNVLAIAELVGTYQKSP